MEPQAPSSARIAAGWTIFALALFITVIGGPRLAAHGDGALPIFGWMWTGGNTLALLLGIRLLVKPSSQARHEILGSIAGVALLISSVCYAASVLTVRLARSGDVIELYASMDVIAMPGAVALVCIALIRSRMAWPAALVGIALVLTPASLAVYPAAQGQPQNIVWWSLLGPGLVAGIVVPTLIGRIEQPRPLVWFVLGVLAALVAFVVCAAVLLSTLPETDAIGRERQWTGVYGVAALWGLVIVIGANLAWQTQDRAHAVRRQAVEPHGPAPSRDHLGG